MDYPCGFSAYGNRLRASLIQAEADLYTTRHSRRLGLSAMAYPLGADRDSRRLADSPDAAASRSFHVSGGLPRFSIFRKTA
jgi:hypothetical protein